ncbi:hypothetical protein KSP39_PZI017750 [Platanthera zijinensis]|uniref:Uncharacterized protein n=1 Tax=Platanthera zijinensis TaxID=2320716 RepID=A0AAP0FZP4_9ASPA
MLCIEAEGRPGDAQEAQTNDAGERCIWLGCPPVLRSGYVVDRLNIRWSQTLHASINMRETCEVFGDSTPPMPFARRKPCVPFADPPSFALVLPPPVTIASPPPIYPSSSSSTSSSSAWFFFLFV